VTEPDLTSSAALMRGLPSTRQGAIDYLDRQTRRLSALIQCETDRALVARACACVTELIDGAIKRGALR
jgi:hypothetical protein